jgi:hypothetical protein
MKNNNLHSPNYESLWQVYHARNIRAVWMLRWVSATYALIVPLSLGNLPAAILSAIFVIYAAEVISTKLHNAELAAIKRDLEALKQSDTELHNYYESLLAAYARLTRYKE